MPSVGSVGDPIDNAVAESTIGLYKTELIRRQGAWRSIDEVELATLEYIDWFNHRRIHGGPGRTATGGSTTPADRFPRLEPIRAVTDTRSG
jgi:transposase InsO family protein